MSLGWELSALVKAATSLLNGEKTLIKDKTRTTNGYKTTFKVVDSERR